MLTLYVVHSRSPRRVSSGQPLLPSTQSQAGVLILATRPVIKAISKKTELKNLTGVSLTHLIGSLSRQLFFVLS